jgi:multisubunit Na+/H+ antiporter MnhE subunit
MIPRAWIAALLLTAMWGALRVSQVNLAHFHVGIVFGVVIARLRWRERRSA